jgi:NAD+ synthase (glutamine-hydrolysing)
MNGFIKVAAAAPVVEVAHCPENIRRIESLMRRAEKLGVQVIVFPELAVTGYTCMDLFAQNTLQRKAEEAFCQLVNKTKDLHLLSVVGMPLVTENKRFNTAVAFQSGQILGVVPKTYIPNYREFQEARWFASATERRNDRIRIGDQTVPFGENLLFSGTTARNTTPPTPPPHTPEETKAANHPAINTNHAKTNQTGTPEVTIGIEICEDLWAPVPPSSLLATQGATLLLNLSASHEETGKNDYLKTLITQQSARCIAGYVYASAGFGESTTDLVYTGKGFIAENGSLLNQSQRFTTEEKLITADIHIDYLQSDRLLKTNFTAPTPQSTTTTPPTPRHIPFQHPLYTGTFDRFIDPHPFVPSKNDTLKERCEEICHLQTFGLIKRLKHTATQSAVIGISGGLDSTLALITTIRAFDQLQIPRKNILAVTMPGFGTTGRTHQNAIALIRSSAVTLKEIPIRDACIQHFKDIGHDGKTPDITYENAQARERTQLLMDLANQTNGLVIGTGDLSELALGWATYNGDHMSMYNVNADIPKTLVRHLIEWTAHQTKDPHLRETLTDITRTPISPELTPVNKDGATAQKTEEIIGPYELHDFFLYHFLRFGASPRKTTFLARQAFGEKYSDPEIQKYLKTFLTRFFSQQFKRSCLPDGPKIGSVSLSPRGDWRMPSDASAASWLEDLLSKDTAYTQPPATPPTHP